MIQLFSPTIRRKEMDAVLTCLVDEKIGPGDMNARLVSEVKNFIGCEGALALRSPEIALYYALKALNFPKDSLVLISALSPSWQSIALERLGYRVMVLDVEDTTGVMSVEEAKKGVLAGGKLFLIHETFGIAPDLTQICSLGIPVIEDISHSAGASFQDKKYGLQGVFSIWGLEEDDIVTSGGGALLIAPSRAAWNELA
nr:DegT/DnrJ/EryC1/StrS family aminotransferase [Treponema sp.]